MTIIPFIAWNCPVAITKANNKGCHAAMCNPCMAIWQSTGSRSNNQLSAQEVVNVARIEEAKAKENLAKGRQRSSSRGTSKRSQNSQRAVEAELATKSKTSKPRCDRNGCCHGNRIHGWQSNNNPVYWQDSWRKKQNPNYLLSMNCIDCNLPILRWSNLSCWTAEPTAASRLITRANYCTASQSELLNPQPRHILSSRLI